MKITRTRLKKIIKEELNQIDEGFLSGLFGGDKEEPEAEPESEPEAEPKPPIERFGLKINSRFGAPDQTPEDKEIEKRHLRFLSRSGRPTEGEVGEWSRINPDFAIATRDKYAIPSSYDKSKGRTARLMQDPDWIEYFLNVGTTTHKETGRSDVPAQVDRLWGGKAAQAVEYMRRTGTGKKIGPRP